MKRGSPLRVPSAICCGLADNPPIPPDGPSVEQLFVRSTMVDYVAGNGCVKRGRRVAMAALATAAGVAELADALDLGSSDANRGGSSPPARTMEQPLGGEDLVITGDLRCK